MGGGDLNLKKSWHPSTMKNMEKVWKAEQQEHQEKRKIAELKKEIEMEKDREDMTKYAMEQGVIEKKDDKKLDWMYKGPNQMINREEYLLGRPIDKTFEQMAQAEKNVEMNQPPKNHVEYECIPPSLRFFSGNEQVDLARKMQEDPLYAIKKKEMETRNQLLKNPVKLKQLRQLLEQQTKKHKDEKKHKKKKKKSKHDTDDSDEQLDNLLAAKYKELKDKINEKDLLKSMKKVKRKKKTRAKKHNDSSNDDSSDSESSSDESVDDKRSKKRKKRKRSTSNENAQEKESKKKYEKEENKGEQSRRDINVKHKERNSESRERKQESSGRISKDHRKEKDRDRSRSPWHKRNGFYKTDETDRRNSDNRYSRKSSSFAEKDNAGSNTRTFSHESYRLSKENKREEQKWGPRKRPQLTEEEKERRRQEMIANASWRDKERERNVKQYQEEEKKELASSKTYNKDFIRKQLAVAAEVGTVASRIKSNINNIQRSNRAMDTNFAKR